VSASGPTPTSTPSPTIRLIGGPTALITYGGLRILTDPTFDPPGDYPRPGTPVVLHKVAPPGATLDEVLPVDLVLLSHDHHSDNLDHAGRAMLGSATHVLTTGAGAERLGESLGNAVGLSPGEMFGYRGVSVTAVEALHGPPEVAAKNGPVIGFVLHADGQPTVYVSGDNALVEVVERIAESYGPFGAVVLFIGGACVPAAWGDALLTLDAARAVEVARLLDPAPIVPIHQDSWAHFSSGATDVEAAFMAAGMSDRLRPIALGQTIPLA
jgi:L-ascorbate metabolism protein UlaG (beta-lactamase superfamily)